MTIATPPMTPQSLAEHAVAVSNADDCVVVVSDTTSANLRWANNTLTTNGVMHGVSVTVVSFVALPTRTASPAARPPARSRAPP